MLKLLVVRIMLWSGGFGAAAPAARGGFRSPRRADFESALNLLDSEQDFDLVLLDLALPGIDGFAGLDILRKRYPAIPVAVVSAYDDVPTITRVANHGASGFIPRPLPATPYSMRCGDSRRQHLPPGGSPSPAKLDDAQPAPPQKRRRQAFGDQPHRSPGAGTGAHGARHSNRDISAAARSLRRHRQDSRHRRLQGSGRGQSTQALVAVARYGVDFDSVFWKLLEAPAVWPGGSGGRGRSSLRSGFPGLR